MGVHSDLWLSIVPCPQSRPAAVVTRMAKYSIVMVRHGESEWNKLNKFCGWFDADLSETGVKEAHAAGKALKDAGYKFDLAYTSVLTRANRTLGAILEEINQKDIPVEKTWRLNERHYGGLTGLNKAHGNSLRGIVKHLDNMSDEAIMGCNLPTGIPFVYELDADLKPVVSMQFLGDEETVKKAIESVANQGKAK